MSDSPRGVVRHCPYCAEEDLWPVEDPNGGWECRACARVFTVSLARIEAAHIPGRLAQEQALGHTGEQAREQALESGERA